MIEDVYVLVIAFLCFIVGFLARGELQRLRKKEQQ